MAHICFRGPGSSGASLRKKNRTAQDSFALRREGMVVADAGPEWVFQHPDGAHDGSPG